MNKRTATVSIGLPVYNGAAFIRQALDRLLNQSYSDFELIISDNASSDDTELICREAAARDRRIRYLRQARNIGVLANFQFTLEQARGKYFMWAACDDWWDTEFVATLAGLLDCHPASVVAFSRIHHVDMQGRVFRDYPRLSELQGPIGSESATRVMARNSFDAFMLQDVGHGKVNIIYGLMRREPLVAAETLKRWEHVTWGQDLLVVANILRYGDVVFSDRLLWKKTENPNSAGSATPSPKPFRLLKSALNVARTYALYLRYCQGLWQVQGAGPGLAPIPLGRRVAFTGIAWYRMTVWFGSHFLRALCRRTRALGLRTLTR